MSMKILAAGCFHGRVPKNFKSFVKKNRIDLIISLGDHCDADEIRDIQFRNWDKFEGRKYYGVMRDLLGIRYRSVYRKFAESGRKTLEKLDDLGLPVFVIEGNNEFSNRDKRESGLKLPTLEDIVRKSSNLSFLSGKIKQLEGCSLIGASGYRGVGIKNKRDSKWRKVNREWRKLEILFSKAKDNVIFVGHDMPFGCKLDKVNNPHSPMHGKHVGDEIIRKYIIAKSPKMYVGAHMHEWQGTTKIRNTLVVASGYGREGRAALIELPKLRAKLVKTRLPTALYTTS